MRAAKAIESKMKTVKKIKANPVLFRGFTVERKNKINNLY